MLNLKTPSQERWLAQVDECLEEVLIDHAHCEHKAAANAMSIMGMCITNQEVCREMTQIVTEELEHFHLVIALLERRGIEFRCLPPTHYGRELNLLLRPSGHERMVDRLLVAGLIEARSCERFSLLAEHIQDVELAEFYRSLFESEARHHTTYVRLAKQFAPDSVVKQRLQELSQLESEIVGRGNPLPRMHS